MNEPKTLLSEQEVRAIYSQGEEKSSTNDGAAQNKFDHRV